MVVRRATDVISLRDYFPEAALVGAEINPALLRLCRALPPDPRRTFIASSPEAIAAHGPYDAIFAMAVFTRLLHTIGADGPRIEPQPRIAPIFRRHCVEGV